MYPNFTISCEISGQCVETTLFRKSWSGSYWAEKYKFSQVKVEKKKNKINNTETCVISSPPSSFPSVKDETNGQKVPKRNEIGSTAIIIACIVSFISIVLLSITLCGGNPTDASINRDNFCRGSASECLSSLFC